MTECSIEQIKKGGGIHAQDPVDFIYAEVFEYVEKEEHPNSVAGKGTTSCCMSSATSLLRKQVGLCLVCN